MSESFAFTLFDRELTIEDRFLLDILLHGRIIRLAEKASSMFEEYYHSNLHSIEDILNKSYGAATYMLNKCAEAYVDMLCSVEFYSISAPDILSQMDGSYFEDELNDLEYWYLSSKIKEKQKDIQRKERRKNRSKIVIRGRTLTGAIAGAATAGTLNLASGIIHGTTNVIGKSFSSMGSSITKAGMFNDPNTCRRFCTAMYMDVFDWIYIIEDMIIKEGIPLKRITIADEEKCERLLQNLSQANLSHNQSYEVAFQLFQINPSEFGYYDFCLQKFPEQQANLLKLAERCEVDLTSSIDKIFQVIFSSSSHKTEEEVKLIREKMRLKQEELGIATSATIEKVDAMLQDFDLKARTFREFTFETREQCQKAKADFNSLTTLCGKIDKLTTDECKRLIQEVPEKEYSPEISAIFSRRLKLRLTETERDEAKRHYEMLYKQYKEEMPDLKKYKALEKFLQIIRILGALLFLGCVSLSFEACTEGSVAGTIIFLLISCLIVFVSIRCIDDPLEKKKAKLESTMPQDLLEAKERKETTQKEFDKIIQEMQEERNQSE